MSFTRKEIGEMIIQVERNPDNKYLKSILKKMQCNTSKEIIEEIMEMASQTFPDNPNKFIILIDNDKKQHPFLNAFHGHLFEDPDDKPSRHHCNDIRSFLENYTRGAIPLNNFEFNNEFNLIDSDGEAIGHHCRVYDDDVNDLKERLIACVCEEIPESPHVIAYKLIKSLDGAPEAIERICHENQSQVKIKVCKSRDNYYDNDYYVSIQNIIRHCADGLSGIYLKKTNRYIYVQCTREQIKESKKSEESDDD